MLSGIDIKHDKSKDDHTSNDAALAAALSENGDKASSGTEKGGFFGNMFTGGTTAAATSAPNPPSRGTRRQPAANAAPITAVSAPAEKMAYHVFTIAQIPVFVHYTLPVLFIIIIAINTSRWGGAGFGYGFLYSCILIGTVLVHELGHSFAAKKINCKVEKILLWPLGGLAFCCIPANPRHRMFVSVCGPLTHVPMMLFWVLMLLPLKPFGVSWYAPSPLSDHFWNWLCCAGLQINVMLMLFNLFIPVFPLDGSQILLNFLLDRDMHPYKAAWTIIYISVPIALCLMVEAILTFNMLSAFVVIWLGFQTFQLYQAVSNNSLHLHALFANVPNADSPPPGAAPQNAQTAAANAQPIPVAFAVGAPGTSGTV